MNIIKSHNELLAPVFVSVYDRKEHLSKCVNALLENAEAGETVLYIVSDGAKEKTHEPSIESVRNYIRTITGFKEVKTRFREENWGMQKSTLDAIEWVLSENDCFIRMEDDIVCSTFYLKYMNEALKTYSRDMRVFGITAYTHPDFNPPKKYPHEVFLWNSMSTWGHATWKDRWETFIEENEKARKQLSDKSVWKAFRKTHGLSSPRKTYINGFMHIDVRINIYLFVRGLYAVCPVKSLTTNSGMDGSGTHCSLGWTHPKQIHSQHPVTLPKTVVPSAEIHQTLQRLHYSFVNYTLARILRQIGVFDPMYNFFRKFIEPFFKRRQGK